MFLTTRLAHSPSEIIRQLMIADGKASDGGTLNASNLPAGDWPAFKGVEPDKPDEVITVFTTTGTDSGRTQVDGEVASFFGFQVRVRSYDGVRCFARAAVLRDWMQALLPKQVTVNGTVYLIPAISGIGQVNELSRDRPPTGRWVCTVNAVSAIRVVT